MALPLSWHASLLAAPVLLVWAGCVAAACQQTVGRFSSIQGEVEVRGDMGGDWHPARLDDPLCEGDTIQVGIPGRAALLLTGNTVLRLEQDTTLQLVDIGDDSEQLSWIDLSKGAVYTFSRQPRKLKVIARHLMALIKGTEFQVRVTDDVSRVAVLEGSVEVSNDLGSALARPGGEVVAQAGQAPRFQAVAHPRDAVE